MSEADDEPLDDLEELDEDVPEVVWTNEEPFPEKVWRTLSMIDMTEYVSVKKVKVQAKGDRKAYEFSLDYISWVDAWQRLMNCFPESHFEFDPPSFFPNGTGEQWITLTIKQGEREMVRKWWLPFMDQKNQPVADPSSTQINNTRMRVLVKCIAMCGLGIEVYGGEDTSDQEQDAEPVRSKSVRQDVLDEINLSEDEWATVQEWTDQLKEIAPNKDNIDQAQLLDWFLNTNKLGDLTIAIYQKLASWQRTALTKIRNEHQAKKRAEAVDQLDSLKDDS